MLHSRPKSDIDFDFVIDCSGSVGAGDWATTMKMIGEKWIKEVIRPSGSQCGNHVAGRWFSDRSQRFYDFQPPASSRYAPKSYAGIIGRYS